MHYAPYSVYTSVCSCIGFNKKGLKVDMNRVSMILNNDMGGTSTKNMMHWTQMVKADKV